MGLFGGSKGPNLAKLKGLSKSLKNAYFVLNLYF